MNPRLLLGAGVIGAGLGLLAVAALSPDPEPDATEADHALALAMVMEGALYSYGGGGPGAPLPTGAKGLNGGVGWDCSGSSLAVLAAAGLYPWDGPRMSADEISNIGDPVAWGKHRPFDLPFYGTKDRASHVTVILDTPDEEGESPVMTASGLASTNGDDPSRRIRITSAIRYPGRTDFRGIVRLRRPVSDLQARTCAALRDALLGQPQSVWWDRQPLDVRRELWNRYRRVLPVKVTAPGTV